MANIGTVTTILNAQTSKFQRQIGAADKSLKSLGTRASSVGKKITGFGKTLSLAVTAPIIAISGFAIKAAADAEETASKFKTVFESISKEAAKTAKNLSKGFDLAITTSEELLSSTGDLLVGFGFSEKAALDLARKTNELALDLVSFTNFSGGATGASNALTKALLGETESLKSLGIAILQEDVKKQVAINTAKGLIFETERQAKAFATLILAQNQSQKAIGDYARTAGSLSNRMRRVTETLRDLKIEFGKLLADTLKLDRVFDRLGGVIKRVANFLNRLSPRMQKIVVVSLLLAATLGPVLIALGVMVRNIGALVAFLGVAIPTIGGFIASLFAIIVPILAVVGALAAIGFAIVNIFGKGETFKERMMDVFNNIKNTVMTFTTFFLNNIVRWKNAFVATVKIFFIEFKFAFIQIENFLSGVFENFFTLMIDFGKNTKIALEFVRDNWKEIFQNIGLTIIGFFKNIGSAARVFGSSFIEFLKNPAKGFKEGTFKKIRDELTKEIALIEIPPPKFQKSELRSILSETLAIEARKVREVEEAFASAFGGGIIERIKSVIDAAKEVAKAVPGPDDKTITAKFAGAFEKGSVEAARAELAQEKIQVKIEKNLKEQIKNQKEMINQQKRLVDAFKEGAVDVQVVEIGA